MRTEFSHYISYLLISASFAGIVGCKSADSPQSDKNIVSAHGDRPESSADSLELGRWITGNYKSKDAVSQSKEYRLSVTNRIHSGDGRFILHVIDQKDGARTEFAGKRFTQRGIPTDADATVWQLVPDSSDTVIYNFIYKSDANNLILLNDQYESTDIVLTECD